MYTYLQYIKGHHAQHLQSFTVHAWMKSFPTGIQPSLFYATLISLTRHIFPIFFYILLGTIQTLLLYTFDYSNTRFIGPLSLPWSYFPSTYSASHVFILPSIQHFYFIECIRKASFRSISNFHIHTSSLEKLIKDFFR